MFTMLMFLQKSECVQKLECVSNDTNVKKYLFIGNSFTLVNNLPNMFLKLSKQAPGKTQVYVSARGSASFNSHDHSEYTTDLIGSQNWTGIIMQEQSMFLAQQPYMYYRSIPYLRNLFNKSKYNTKQIILFETWGYRGGDLSYDFNDNYFKMQERLNNGYSNSLQELLLLDNPNNVTITIAQVGETWKVAYPVFKNKLWGNDYMHPGKHGTYLSACVFYKLLHNKSPVGNKFIPRRISKRDARKLQRISIK